MFRGVAVLLTVMTGAAQAGPYDGLYRPDFDWAATWDCRTVGMDGGALAVRDGLFHGVENTCRLTNPVAVRGMQATLYDAVCEGEGMREDYRIMLLKTDAGLTFVARGTASALRRCE